MKLLFTFVLTIFSLSVLASESQKFTCDAEYEVLSISVKIHGQDDYEVKINTSYSEVDVWSKWITFDEKGQMNSLQTSGGVENIHIMKVSEGRWEGEYWYDNSLLKLVCTPL